jgi:hypothetical protein
VAIPHEIIVFLLHEIEPLTVLGDTYRRVSILKHDSWAATAIYRNQGNANVILSEFRAPGSQKRAMVRYGAAGLSLMLLMEGAKSRVWTVDATEIGWVGLRTIGDKLRWRLVLSSGGSLDGCQCL